MCPTMKFLPDLAFFLFFFLFGILLKINVPLKRINSVNTSVSMNVKNSITDSENPFLSLYYLW